MLGANEAISEKQKRRTAQVLMNFQLNELIRALVVLRRKEFVPTTQVNSHRTLGGRNNNFFGMTTQPWNPKVTLVVFSRASARF